MYTHCLIPAEKYTELSTKLDKTVNSCMFSTGSTGRARVVFQIETFKDERN